MPDNVHHFQNFSEFCIMTNDFKTAEELIMQILPKADKPIDKAILYYLLSIALISLDKQSEDAEQLLGKILPAINTSVWPTQELVKWAKTAKLTPQKRSKIKSITALIIQKDNPDAII